MTEYLGQSANANEKETKMSVTAKEVVTSKVQVGTIGEQDGFFTKCGGFCVWGDGDSGIVTYDQDVINKVTDIRDIEVSVFDHFPTELTYLDGEFVDDRVEVSSV